MIDIFFIAFAAACWGVVWVAILTHPTGILWFVPKYYPSLFAYALSCNVCVAGWTSFVVSCFALHWSMIIPCMCFAMVFSNIIREKGGFQ